MSKEQSTFIVDIIDIAKRAECKITITAKSGQVVCEIGPETFPFTVNEDGSVHMKTAEIDYEALNKDVGELMQYLDLSIGTLRREIFRMSAKAGGEHASHVSMSFYEDEPRLTVKPLDEKHSWFHVKINEDGTDANVSVAHNDLKGVVIPIGKATDIIRSLRSYLKDVEPTGVPLFDPRKDIGETFSKACKSWTESIAKATGPRSDLAKTIENLTVRLDPEELYGDLLKSSEFKSVILDALCRSPRTVHIKL
ncbi:hypothetical protein [Brucella tritici]|uniref:hypothetical protein n=1 Tax=Brucella tritici TaxID=94626 RepID=UPI0015913780|nr:hypothetical protein [Brucella tritici]